MWIKDVPLNQDPLHNANFPSSSTLPEGTTDSRVYSHSLTHSRIIIQHSGRLDHKISDSLARMLPDRIKIFACNDLEQSYRLQLARKRCFSGSMISQVWDLTNSGMSYQKLSHPIAASFPYLIAAKGYLRSWSLISQECDHPLSGMSYQKLSHPIAETIPYLIKIFIATKIWIPPPVHSYKRSGSQIKRVRVGWTLTMCTIPFC